MASDLKHLQYPPRVIPPDDILIRRDERNAQCDGGGDDDAIGRIAVKLRQAATREADFRSERSEGDRR